jgi:hypothetical protein
VAQLAPTEPLCDLFVLAQLEPKAPLQIPQNGSTVQKWLTKVIWLNLSRNYFHCVSSIKYNSLTVITIGLLCQTWYMQMRENMLYEIY